MATLSKEVRFCNKTGQVRGVKRIKIWVFEPGVESGVGDGNIQLELEVDLSPKGLAALRQGIFNGLKPNGSAVATLGMDAIVVPTIDKIASVEPWLPDATVAAKPSEEAKGLATTVRTSPGAEPCPSGPVH